MKAGCALVGTKLFFKNRPYLIATYGKFAVVTDRSRAFTGSHPGQVFKTLIDLVTENGTKIQWDQSMVTDRFKEIDT